MTSYANSLSIVFAGTPAFGVPCLDALARSNYNLKAVYTQPDRPAGRGRQLQASAVKQWSEAQHLPIYQPINFKDAQSLADLEAIAPDVMVVIAYGLLLPKAVLEIPRLGCINVHASLLPRWRGASPIQHAILSGDDESGITIMQMDVGMDTGAMLERVNCPLDKGITASDLHDRLAQLAPPLLLQTLAALSSGQIHPQPQDNSLATYAPKISKGDAAIDWSKSAKDIDQQIRAFNPWPIAYTQAGDTVLRIHQARVIEKPYPESPGTIMSLDKTGMLIACGHQGLLVERFQFPGGKAMSVADWLNAKRDQLHVNLVLQ